MTLRVIMILSTVILMVGGVDGVGQTKRELTVWVIRESSSSFDEFEKSFIDRIRTTGKVNNIKFVSSSDEMKYQLMQQKNGGSIDIWVLLQVSQSVMHIEGYQDGDVWLYSMTGGYFSYDTHEFVFRFANQGSTIGGTSSQNKLGLRNDGIRFGSEVGVFVGEYVLERRNIDNLKEQKSRDK